MQLIMFFASRNSCIFTIFIIKWVRCMDTCDIALKSQQQF